MKKSLPRQIKILFIALAALCVASALFVVLSNVIMVNQEQKKIVSIEDATKLNAQCILILGAGVWGQNTPSPMLEDRLKEGLKLYEQGAAPKILVSGDHGQKDYDEVNVMKNYLIDAGVPSEDIFMDHAGFSTYESMVRAKEVFGVSRLIVVTQEYHMYRALYICDQLGMQALGVHADPRVYQGDLYRNARELLARDKDILSCLFKVKPTYLGEPVDISGNGDMTNDY